MGNPVTVGPLTYTIVETDWRDALDGATGARIPQSRFMVVNLTVLNKGSKDAGIPLLTLIDATGKEYRELDKGDGVPQWLGLLRQVRPSETESGRILFDAPQGSYKIRVSSGGEAETEVTALVDLPYLPDTSVPKPFDAGNPPGAPVK